MTRTDDVQDFRNDEQRENPIGGAGVVDEEEVTNTYITLIKGCYKYMYINQYGRGMVNGEKAGSR